MSPADSTGDGIRLLIVGPPGSGKGTQSVRLTEAFEIPAIATGDIFRQNIREQTPLGVQVKAIIDAGDYVPDELTNELVASRLHEDDARRGFLLDGYPRTIEQLHFLDRLLAENGTALDAVIQLSVDEHELVGRLIRRAAQDGRSDDTEETIRHRQQLYARETAPLIAVYRERGLVDEVDALGTMDEVSERIAHALVARGLVQPTR